MEVKQNNVFLYISVISVNLLSLTTNIGYSWTSPFLPKLNGNIEPENNPLPNKITILEESGITTMLNIGALCGPLFTGYISKRIGKKMTLILFSVPVLLSNIILIFANNVWYFYISRFLLGTGIGCVYCIIPPYVAEISDMSNRGKTGVCISLMNLLGHISVVSIGPYVSIKTFAYISLIPSILFIIVFIPFIPESPYYFVYNNKMLEAENALKKFRQKPDVKHELKEITDSVQQTKVKGSLKDLLMKKVILKGLAITIGLMLCQQINGSQPLNAYQQEIFQSSGISLPSEVSVIIVGLFQFFPSILIVFIVDKVRRKVLLLISYFGLLISLVSIGTYFYFKEHNLNVMAIYWIPVTSTCIFMISFKLGAGPLAWTYVGEVFPLNLKIYMSAIVTFSSLIFGLIVTFIFPIMFTSIGIAWTFWIFAILTGASILFIVFTVPEIKGKSFLDIQIMLKK